uniref:Uncharacterized protein n=1 Tax=Arundo donax TaxID=35708 RepID=A0A0A9BN55_ARUDO
MPLSFSGELAIVSYVFFGTVAVELIVLWICILHCWFYFNFSLTVL